MNFQMTLVAGASTLTQTPLKEVKVEMVSEMVAATLKTQTLHL